MQALSIHHSSSHSVSNTVVVSALSPAGSLKNGAFNSSATPVAEAVTAKAITAEAMLVQLRAAIQARLAPQVRDIDQGSYPQAFMQEVGAMGGFAQAVSPAYGGMGNGLGASILTIAAISEECLCTGFMSWCQIACTWYMQNSDNPFLKAQILPWVATGKALGGTGLSNPMKHFAGIEKIALHAERQPGGYRVNGLLPWVSNIGSGHYFGMAAKVTGTDDYVNA
jgi:alkylation response protein AidB-like acyl-CoA dehydrogenase